MSSYRSYQENSFTRAVKKFLLSAFVVFAFIAYAVQQHFTNAAADSTNSNTSANSGTGQQVASGNSSQGQSNYKDGTYTGPVVDAYYGLVQVEATVKNGQISDVKFLEYPNDRRTSQRINSIAMPYLKQEAIQAQSANVNIISGATLTSEAFANSLQTALKSAHN